MALKDFLPKKPSKVEQDKADDAEVKAFFADFEVFQKAKGKRLAAVVVHDGKGSHVEWTLLPFDNAA